MEKIRIIEIINDIKDKPNKELLECEFILFEEYEKTKEIVIELTKHMDTIEEMCSVIKRAIEEESKIQHELRIKFMDFTVDNSTLNYVNPPIPKLEALEDWRNDRLCIPQLQCLI